MNYLLKKEIDDHICILYLNRPEAYNAFNTAMAVELIEILHELDDSQNRVIIIASTNEKAFCTGADLKERNGMTDEQWKEQHLIFQQMFNMLSEMKQIVIAAVNGFALGGGFEMILNCDLIVASDKAKLALPEVTRGIMPGCGGTRLLGKRVGVHIAKEWACTGRIILAAEANEQRLFNRYTTEDNLITEAVDLAKQVAKNAPIAVTNCKRMTEQLWIMDTDEARIQEIETYNQCINTEDRHEGVLAFSEKREPIFLGR